MDNSKTTYPFLKALLLLLLAGTSYFFLDREALPYIGKTHKPLFKALTFLIFPPLHLLIWITAFTLARLKKSLWTLPLFKIVAAQCLAVAFARVFKVIIGRARPDIFIKKGVFGLYGFSWNHHYHSFPSGHALTAFTLATSLSLLFPRFRYYFYFFATLLSLSRPLLFDHYFSDIMGTGAIGMMLASFVHITLKKMDRSQIHETV